MFPPHQASILIIWFTKRLYIAKWMIVCLLNVFLLPLFSTYVFFPFLFFRNIIPPTISTALLHVRSHSYRSTFSSLLYSLSNCLGHFFNFYWFGVLYLECLITRFSFLSIKRFSYDILIAWNDLYVMHYIHSVASCTLTASICNCFPETAGKIYYKLFFFY